MASPVCLQRPLKRSYLSVKVIAGMAAHNLVLFPSSYADEPFEDFVLYRDSLNALFEEFISSPFLFGQDLRDLAQRLNRRCRDLRHFF